MNFYLYIKIHYSLSLTFKTELISSGTLSTVLIGLPRVNKGYRSNRNLLLFFILIFKLSLTNMIATSLWLGVYLGFNGKMF